MVLSCKCGCSDVQVSVDVFRHYGETAFSKNGQPTIEPLKSGVTIGQRVGFSDTDLYKINKLYECPQLNNGMSGTRQSTTDAHVLAGKSTTSENHVEVPETPSAPETTDSSCVDNRRDCEYLATRGHCSSAYSSYFMSRHCPRSCQLCASGSCEDSRSWCTRWANNGLCDTFIFQDYMRSKCRRSCGLC